MKEEVNDELKGLSEQLYQIRQQKDGMKTPAGYFDQFEDRLFAQLDAEGLRRVEEPAPQPFWKVFVQPRSLMAAAACVLLVASMWWWPKAAADNNAPLASADTEIQADALDAYVEENIMDFDPELLAELEDVSDEPISTEPIREPAHNTTTKPHQEQLDNLIDDLSDEELEEIL